MTRQDRNKNLFDLNEIELNEFFKHHTALSGKGCGTLFNWLHIERVGKQQVVKEFISNKNFILNTIKLMNLHKDWIARKILLNTIKITF